MALRIDEKTYRGPSAVHLKRHRKFGKHCTVTKDALSLVEWLVLLDAVTHVTLGKVVGSPAGKFTRRVTFDHKGKHLDVFLVAKHSAQKLHVKLKTETITPLVIQAIEKRWADVTKT
jgi:hypothetical protein